MFRDTNRGKIVEKLCDVSSSKQPVFTNLRRKTLSVADIVPTGTNGDEPMQAGPHPRTTVIDGRTMNTVSSSEPLFFSFFTSNRGKSWKMGRSRQSMQPAHHSRAAYLRYRFPRQPSAFSGSPSAHGGSWHIRSHSSSTEPNPSGTSVTSSSCTCRTTG